MEFHRLAALVRAQHNNLLTRWRAQIRELPSARHLDVPTLNDHMPGLLDALATALDAASDQTIPEAIQQASAQSHGLQRFEDGFDIEEIVGEYNILRGCIHDLAIEHGITLQGKPFHIINRVLDQAIGLALQTFSTQRALDVQRRRNEYLSFVAHDIRTPLSALSLAGRVLELTLPNSGYDTHSAQMLKVLRRNVKQLEQLVLQVLAENLHLQKDDGIKLERRSFDLWPMVELLIDDLRSLSEPVGTQLANAVPDELVVFADANLLTRVLQNLVANAIKYTPGGCVTVGARAIDDGIECWVGDNGSGIPADLLDSVFEKGETDPEKPGGMGLGLAIVKTFVEAHGGSVSVESTQGAGATFRFMLPNKTTAESP
jgi:two-component system phosphate regulon sensor histidine kinase PhoR